MTLEKLSEFGILPLDHHVPDVLTQALKLVFCGTALGRVSAQKKAYYAHPGNLFWRTLYATGLTPEVLAPQDYPRVLNFGIGLTDLCKLHYGNDSDLPRDAFDVGALRQKIQQFKPSILAFTSKTAASAFLRQATGTLAIGFQPQVIDSTRIYVLPSPSGQARRYWTVQAWQDLADATVAL